MTGFHFHVCAVCLCVLVFVYVWSCACAWEDEVDVENYPQFCFHIIHGVRVSQSNPELTSKASLTGQLALGVAHLWFLRLESQVPHPPGILCGFWD